MTESSCPSCGVPLRPNVKFCGGCGHTLVPASAPPPADPAQVARFRAHVTATLRDGTALADILDDLMQDADEMGIGKGEALGTIEAVDAELAAGGQAAVRLWYDADRAGAGVAFGNTILAFRVTNASTRAIQRVGITIQHPLTQDLVVLPEITTLNKDGTKFTEADLVFERVGRQSIRVGWVEVHQLTGASVVYRFEDVVRLNAENSDAARATVHSISQTIQTHGGGVVSTGGVAGAAAGGSPGAWEEVRLVLSTPEALREAERLAEARKPAVPAPPPPLPAAPTHLTAVPTSPTSVQLSWADHATNEDGFYVERSVDGATFTRMATLGPETTSYLVQGLAGGGTYSFRVQAFNAAGTSGDSNVAATVTPAEPAKEAQASTPAPQPIQVVVSGAGATTAVPPPPPPPEPKGPSLGRSLEGLATDAVERTRQRMAEKAAAPKPAKPEKPPKPPVDPAVLAKRRAMAMKAGAGVAAIAVVVAAIAIGGPILKRNGEIGRLDKLQEQAVSATAAGNFDEAIGLLERLVPNRAAFGSDAEFADITGRYTSLRDSLLLAVAGQRDRGLRSRSTMPTGGTGSPHIVGADVTPETAPASDGGSGSTPSRDAVADDGEAEVEAIATDCSADGLDAAAAVVCRLPELSMLDRQLATVYQAAATAGKTTAAAQRSWMGRRLSCMSTADPNACLWDRYQQRLQELSR